MNFVQLVESLRVECGVSGAPLTTIMSVGGELLRLRNWIIAAWNDIQTKHTDWNFLRANFQFNTTASKQSYSLADAGVPTLDTWNQESIWLYDPAIGISDERPLGRMSWEHFRRMYMMGSQIPAKPIAFTINPLDKSISFGSLPDSAYTIVGECWTEPVALFNDADTPAMPAKFHQLIVYEAMKKYAGYEAASEVMARAESEGKVLWNQLVIQQLPQVRIGGALGGGHFNE